MAPTSKENEVLVATPEAGATGSSTSGFRPDETSSRPSPVALEVPVSVNGARTVEGSDKREPFSETTKTVLVFGNGAVIRLSSPVAAGQLLFLTNEKTKKEVVCQVVKSKNYRNVSGYVELEFTESVVGFWGMRFPTDSRPAAATTTAPVAKTTSAAPAPVAAKPAAPAATPIPKAPEAKPAAPVLAQPNLQTPAATPAPPAVVAKPPVPAVAVAKLPEAPTPTIAASLASSVANLLGSPEVPPAAVAKPPAPQPTVQNNVPAKSSDASTEELKQQAARLQEQLSSMLFGETPNAAPTATQKPSAPATDGPQLDTNPDAHRISRVLELAKPEPLAPVKPVVPSKPLPAPAKSSLDTEEVKIPSWLEPLARNAAAPTSTQELIEREKAKHAAELAVREQEEVKPEPLPLATVAQAPVVAANMPEPEAVGIGNLLPLEGESLSQPAQSGSKRGLWIGVAAAAVLAAAGGGWYFLRPTSGAQSPAATAQNVRAALPTTSTAAPAIQPAGRTAPESTTSTTQQTSRPTVSEPLSNAPAATPPITAQPAPMTRESRTSASAIPAASTERIARSAPPAAIPAKPEPKKAGLGEVHLAAPTVSRGAARDSVAAPTISSGTDGAAGGLESELLPGNSNQPAAPKAPLAIGGDVKPAKLLKTTPPMYPALAKTQHISGDVSIDALIDANGKVTTMSVLSGPTLLRQAAMDAVRQWKYQPAALDGKPVSMHLTVTVQFRIQ